MFTLFLVGFKIANPMFNIHFTFYFAEGINNSICRKFSLVNLTILYKIGTPCCSVRKAVLCEIFIRVRLAILCEIIILRLNIVNSCKIFYVFCYSKYRTSEYLIMVYIILQMLFHAYQINSIYIQNAAIFISDFMLTTVLRYYQNVLIKHKKTFSNSGTV